MSRKQIPFTQAQIRRAVRAAESSGLRVRRITINPDGAIVLDALDAGDNTTTALDSQNSPLAGSWDDM